MSEVASLIVNWFRKNQRALPWRISGKRDPYLALVSEVMCQQTRISTVIPYFQRWVQQFPSILVLSGASEDAVRAAWAGLGYYRRAIYLLHGAQFVVAEFKGVLPETSMGLLTVPGVGPYTAGAIASMCHNERCTAIDGNVLRVVSRLKGLQGITVKDSSCRRIVQETVFEMVRGVAKRNVGAVNEGLMEIGATVCTPSGAPQCTKCPLRKQCVAFSLLQNGSIPVIDGFIPMKKTAMQKKVVHVAYLVVVAARKKKTEKKNSTMPHVNTDEVVMTRRDSKGLLANLHEFPSVEATHPFQNRAAIKQLLKKKFQFHSVRSLRHVAAFTHMFSHIEMHVDVFHNVDTTAAVELVKILPMMELVEVGSSCAEITALNRKIFATVFPRLKRQREG